MDLLQQQKDNISTLLANIVSQGEPVDFSKLISTEDIPFEFDILRKVYNVIQAVQDRGLPPNKENVVMGLIQDYSIENADEVISHILDQRGRFGNIEHLSAWIKERKLQIQYQSGIEEITRLMAGPQPMADKIERASQIWGSINSLLDPDQLELDAVGRLDYFIERQIHRYELARLGHSVGPSLKFKAFVGEKIIHYIRGMRREQRRVPGDIPWSLVLKEGDSFLSEEWIREPVVPVLPDGDITLITAEPKKGKSTLSQIIAEHNAFTLGHVVLVLQLETDQDTSEMRAIARNLEIRRDALSTGYLNPRDMEKRLKVYQRDEQGNIISGEQVDGPTVAERFEWYRNWLNSRPGKLVHIYCPGWSVFRINQTIRMMARLSQELDKKLLVIVDYYNKIARDGIHSDSEANALSAIAEHLKTAIAQTGCHGIIFAQETNAGDDPIPYGSRGIQQKGQIHISLRRYRATEELPIILQAANGEKFQKRDALGNKMYWCKDTDSWDARAVLKIVFANDHAGLEAPILFVNSYYNIVDAPPEFKYTDKSMRALEKSS